MQVYAGLDVSLKTTDICLMDEASKIVWRGTSASDPASFCCQEGEKNQRFFEEILLTIVLR